MSGKFILDTNIIIALFAGEQTVFGGLEIADEVFVPGIVLGELYYGAHKSSRSNENILKIDEFAAENQILAVDGETARRYGEIKDYLRSKGRPIPENDVWIAALARQHNYILATRDEHFNEIGSIETTKW